MPELTGQTDLDAMLASLEVTRRPGEYAFVSVGTSDSAVKDLDGNELAGHELAGNELAWHERAGHELAGHASATITEAEGVTYVVATTIADQLGFEVTFRAAWLTLDVHSALVAVGLTAAVSARLAEAGIACNMLAGYFHDHLLVPVDAADAAIVAIESLRTDHRSDGQPSR